jgi:hypothetical protein
VYDGTNGGFSLTALGKLGEVLQPYTGELTDTVCLVGYTANTWSKDSRKNLSLNVQWVVVLAEES